VLRPLSRLQTSGVEVTVLQASKEGYVTPKQVAEAIRGNTKLIAVTHASNVVVPIMPIADIGKVAHDHVYFSWWMRHRQQAFCLSTWNSVS